MIDGGVPQKITATATGSMSLSAAIGTFSGANETVSFYVEQGNTDYAHIEFYNQTTSSTVARALVRFSTEAVSLSVGSGTVAGFKLKGVGPNGGKVFHIALTASSTAGNTRRIQARPNQSVAATATGDYFFAHYIGLVTGAFIPLTPILTQGAAVTRTADRPDVVSPSWTAGRPVGPELVVNGRFDTNADGWTVTGGTLSVAGGTMTITSSTNGVAARGTQTFTTVIGKAYVVKGRLRKTTEGTVSAGIYVNIAGAASSYNALTTWRDVLFYFVATSTSHTINLDISQTSMVAGRAAEFDDISIMEVDCSVTMLVEGETLQAHASVQRYAMLSDGTDNNRVQIGGVSTDTFGVSCVAGNVTQASVTKTGTFGIHRLSASWSAGTNGQKSGYDGTAMAAANVTSVPPGMNKLTIGCNHSGGDSANAWIRRVCLVAGGAILQDEHNVASVVGW